MKLFQQLFGKTSSIILTKTEANTEFITFFRIAIGSIVLIHFMSILVDFNLLYSSQGILPSDIQDVFVPNHLLSLHKVIYYLESLGIPELITLITFKFLYIILCLLLITGVFTNTSSFFLLMLQIIQVKSSVIFAYGVDYFVSMSLFYLVIFPSSQTYSMFSIFTRRTYQVNTVPFRRMFQLHLTIAYLFSGLGKILGYNWWNGESVWKAINLPYVNRDFNFDFTILIEFPFILILLGWTTIILELFYPIFIWYKKTRKIWLWLIISMHVGIALVLNLYFFSAIMIVWNIAAFYFTSLTQRIEVKPSYKMYYFQN